MKNKLRFLALFLCLCQILCLIGCGGESTTTPTEPAEPSKVIPWGADGSIAEQAKAAGEMIICFMPPSMSISSPLGKAIKVESPHLVSE